MKTAARSAGAAVFVANVDALTSLPIFSVAQDGERVEVIGQDRPGAPGALPFLALQPRPPHPVAALEVGDPTLDPGPVAAQSSFRSRRARFLAPGDEDAVGLDRCKLLFGAAVAKAAVERHLPRRQAEAGKLGGGSGQERVLAQIAGAA
jgi:hypothetical protein